MSANGRSCTGGHGESHLLVYSALRLLSSESLHTRPVKEKRKKKKKHQCRPEIGNSGTRKKTKTSGHTKLQKKRVFFCLLFPFFTHIYIYTKASCHFQCVHMNGRQNADAAVFFRLSCSSMLNWHFTDRGGC